jgi:transposase
MDFSMAKHEQRKMGIRAGRPIVATAEYRVSLVKAIKTSPRDLGYPFTVWTITRIRAHMAGEMKTLLSESRVRQIMKEEGLVFKRPKRSLAQKRDKDGFAKVPGNMSKVPVLPIFTSVMPKLYVRP